MRALLFRPFIFYPVLALLAALAVLASLRPAWPTAPLAPAPAVREGTAFDFGALALAAADPGAAHVSFIVRDGDRPTALRLARRAASVGQDSPGAVLTITANDAAAFAGQATAAEIRFRTLPITTAEGLSIRWAGDQAWVSIPVQPGEDRAALVLPPPVAAPTGLEIRIDSTRADYDYGLELVWVRLIPGGTADAAAPAAAPMEAPAAAPAADPAADLGAPPA